MERWRDREVERFRYGEIDIKIEMER